MSSRNEPFLGTQISNSPPLRRVRLLPLLSLVLISNLLLGAGLASAGGNRSIHYVSESEFDRTGPYLAGGLVGGFTTRLEGELTNRSGVDNVEVDPSVGLVGRVGVRITPRIALEAHYEWMKNFETSVSGDEVSETSTSTLTADVKGFLATGQIQPYLAAGAGFLRAKSDDPVSAFQQTDTDFALRFGGGIDFYITPNIGLSADTSYVIPTGDVEDLDYLSVGAGVFFRF